MPVAFRWIKALPAFFMNGSKTAVWRGEPYPMGATWDGEGVNFALFSEHAERVELCLLTPKAGVRPNGYRCAGGRIRSGTAISRRPGPASSTVIGCTGPTIRKRSAFQPE